jgi:hypothetical protein
MCWSGAAESCVNNISVNPKKSIMTSIKISCMEYLAFCGLFFAALLAAIPLSGQNNALHFDGANDYVTLTPINGFAPNSDFTVEMWFRASSPGQNCNGNFRRFFIFTGLNPTTRFEVGECGGDLRFFWSSGTVTSSVIPIPMGGVLVNGDWYHLAVVRSGSSVEIYIDCNLVWTNDPTMALPALNSDFFRVGHWRGGNTPGQDWHGEIDEVRLWRVALNAQDIAQNCGNCVLAGSDVRLIAYWRFDEGIPAGNNTSITMVTDASSAWPNPGVLSSSSSLNPPGFALTGPASNFVASTAPLTFPYYPDHEVFISNLQQDIGLTTICSGRAVHFSITNPSIWPATPPSGANVAISWAYSDDGGTSWITIPPLSPTSTVFNGFSFGSPPNHPATTIDCTNNTLGYVIREYQAIIEVTDPAGICTYTTASATLQIDCPVGNPSISITPAGPLCEGDQVSFSVVLNFPTIAATQISWSISDGFFTTPLTGPAYDNQTAIIYPPSGTYTIGVDNISFIAEINNGTCPPATVYAQVLVDPMPVCGTIAGSPHTNPTNLTQISANPLVYEICPGLDAAVEIVVPFINCIPTWQYMFPSVGVWNSLGTSNDIQNTNVLPHLHPANSPFLWPAGETCIVYRIECLPLSWPNSGCLPCLSETVMICLTPEPPVPVITGTTPICKGDISTLAIALPLLGINYTWYHNGLPVGTGAFFDAENNGCYWVEGIDQCGQTVVSSYFCLDVCEVVAAISCPQPECPCVGDTITLSAASSYSTCGGPLTYTWSWDSGTLVSDNGTSIEHIPDASGTTYTLTVTDVNGCSQTVQTQITPCAN